MAVNDRRRQKKLEKQRARKKEERRAIARRNSQSLGAKLRLASEGAAFDCWMGDTFRTNGISQAVIARSAPGGMVGVVVFLVDTYCLGIKDVMCKFIPRPEYQERFHASFRERAELKPASPDRVRKFVEGAARYAESIGLSNHPEYAVAKLIFGDIDPQTCTEEFVYGRDGKPFYMSGPRDTPARSQQIVSALEKRFGKDGFHYLITAPPGDFSLMDDAFEDEDGDELEFVDDDDVVEGTVRFAADAAHDSLSRPNIG